MLGLHCSKYVCNTAYNISRIISSSSTVNDTSSFSIANIISRANVSSVCMYYIYDIFSFVQCAQNIHSGWFYIVKYEQALLSTD